jgi:hypothetical protein
MSGKRKQIVWEIERKLAEDAARPALFYPKSAACWQPYFKEHPMMVNGNYNGWRFEERLARQIIRQRLIFAHFCSGNAILAVGREGPAQDRETGPRQG